MWKYSSLCLAHLQIRFAATVNYLIIFEKLLRKLNLKESHFFMCIFSVISSLFVSSHRYYIFLLNIMSGFSNSHKESSISFLSLFLVSVTLFKVSVRAVKIYSFTVIFMSYLKFYPQVFVQLCNKHLPFTQFTVCIFLSSMGNYFSFTGTIHTF